MLFSFRFDSIKAHFALFCLQLISTSQVPAGPEKKGRRQRWLRWFVGEWLQTRRGGKNKSNPANLQSPGSQQHVAPNQLGALKKWRVLVSDLGCEHEAMGIYFYRQAAINYQVQPFKWLMQDSKL